MDRSLADRKLLLSLPQPLSLSAPAPLSFSPDAKCRLDIADPYGKWLQGSVLNREGDNIRIHYDNWGGLLSTDSCLVDALTHVRRCTAR